MNSDYIDYLIEIAKKNGKNKPKMARKFKVSKNNNKEIRNEATKDR